MSTRRIHQLKTTLRDERVEASAWRRRAEAAEAEVKRLQDLFSQLEVKAAKIVAGVEAALGEPAPT
jgi:hypothetical protein